MKLKTTKKAIKESNDRIISCGDGDLQNLLTYKRPFAYSTRIEGWSCDYYEIKDLIICSGHSTIGDRIEYAIIKKYDKKAREIKSESRDHAAAEKALEILINDFIEEVTKND
jgi:hypothetical protein